MPDNGQEKLHRLLNKAGTVFATHVNISNQRNVRDKLSKKWDTVVPMLEVKIGKLVQNQMTSDDILSRKAALSYFLISSHDKEIDAQLFLKRLAASIYADIFACDTILDELQVSLHTHQIPLNQQTSIDELKATLFRTDDSDGWEFTVSKENYAVYQPEKAEHQLVKNIIIMRSSCDRILAKMNPFPSTDDEVRGYTAALVQLSENSQLVNNQIAELCNLNIDTKIVDALAITDSPQPPPETYIHPLTQELIKLAGDEAELVYFPVWAVEKELVNTYRGGVVRNLPSGTVELNTGTETSIAPYKIDHLVAQKIKADMQDLTADDDEENVTFILPLHINTIQNKDHFRKIELILKTLTIVERKNLKVEIFGATEYTTAATLLAIINKVKAYCSGVGFRKPNSLDVSPALKRMGITHIGFHIDDLGLDNIDPNKAVEKLGEAAEKAQLGSFIYGVDNVAISALSIGAGIKFISGEAVGNPLETPWGSLPFAVESLYTRVLSS